MVRWAIIDNETQEVASLSKLIETEEQAVYTLQMLNTGMGYEAFRLEDAEAENIVYLDNHRG